MKYITLEYPDRFVCRHDYYHCGEKIYRVGKLYFTHWVDGDIVLDCDKENLYFKTITEKMYFDHFCTDNEIRKAKLKRLNGQEEVLS